MTAEQYIELERAAEFRHFFYHGEMRAMPVNPVRNALIGTNLSGNLWGALRGRSCFLGAFDMRTRVTTGFITYPDIVAVCGEAKFADGRRDTLLNPSLIIEVLSPSTEAHDRGFKAQQYRQVESLQEYALVSQSEARIEVFRRQEGGTWLLMEAVGLDAVCRFESVESSVALAEVYDKVAFDAEEPPLRPPAPQGD